MESGQLINRITSDLAIIWGEMAPFMVKKRLADVGGSHENLTSAQCMQLIDLLQEKTLKTTLGEQEARRKAVLYKKWVSECFPAPDNQ